MPAQFEQFPADALGSPQVIIAGHGLDQGHRLGRDIGLPRGRFRSLPPVPAEEVAMPAEEGIRLHKEKCLLPSFGRPREYDQEEPISPGTRWALDLTTEDDQRLPEQRSFGDKFGLGASEVDERSGQRSAIGWLRPLKQALVHATGPV
jgi:hypothetical protein